MTLYALYSPVCGFWLHSDDSLIEYPEDIASAILVGLQRLWPKEGWRLCPVDAVDHMP